MDFTKIAIIREFLTVYLASKFASSKLIHTWHAQNLKTHALSHRSCMKYLKFLNLHEISLNIAKNSSRLCLWNFYSLFLCVMRSTIFSFIILIFFLPSRSTRERNSHFFQLIFDCWMIDEFFFIFLHCHWWSQQDETFVLIKRPWQRFFSSLEWIFNAMQMKKQQNVSRELTRKIF